MNYNKLSFRVFISTLLFAWGLMAADDSLAQSDEPVKMIIHPADEGPVINRHIFGQFAEHLGTGIYGGVWVGTDSGIPNTRGIRNDVVEALKELKIPNIRWPGGCFADNYNWRDGIGTPGERTSRINVSWGGSSEPNTFGTHEFFDFLSQIGSDAFISANMGSGTIREAADWLEYLTATGTSLAEERARNGHPEPYEVAFWGFGNESWGCGGMYSADEYVRELIRFASFSYNYNNDVTTQFVSVGPDPDVEESLDYTEAVMKAWANRSWTWNIHALSLHRYTRGGWPPLIKATGFGEYEYASVIEETLGMDDFIIENRIIMDQYDPDNEVSILVDEWGTWYEATEGTNPGHLQQQNSQRDAILAALNLNIFVRHADRVRGANIAQMVNVLQAMIFTDEEKMVLTPTYHAFRMYVPFQDATRITIDFDKGVYQAGDISLPQTDAIAAKGENGQIYVAITNIDPNNQASFELSFEGYSITDVTGETLYASQIDAINTFENPDHVSPKKITAKLTGNNVSVTVDPQSLTVLTFNP